MSVGPLGRAYGSVGTVELLVLLPAAVDVATLDGPKRVMPVPVTGEEEEPFSLSDADEPREESGLGRGISDVAVVEVDMVRLCRSCRMLYGEVVDVATVRD